MAETIEQRDVEELLSVMEQWGIAELHLQMDDMAVDLVRATHDVGASVHPITTATPALEVAEEPCREIDVVKAPVVGVFHLIPQGFPGWVPDGRGCRACRTTDRHHRTDACAHRTGQPRVRHHRGAARR